jgi:hypothetical protein
MPDLDMHVYQNRWGTWNARIGALNKPGARSLGAFKTEWEARAAARRALQELPSKGGNASVAQAKLPIVANENGAVSAEVETHDPAYEAIVEIVRIMAARPAEEQRLIASFLWDAFGAKD